MFGGAARLIPISGVESRLSAAGLPMREYDLNIEVLKQPHSSIPNFRKERINHAGSK